MSAWWTNEKISSTVDRAYIIEKLPANKREALHRPLSFGGDLTDDTYLDWILQKGRRWFLTLDALGVSHRIFGIIDKSCDDDDLPLSEDTLWRLDLFEDKTQTLDRKFYRQQFNYLIQDLAPDRHTDYGSDEVIPVEPDTRRIIGTQNSACDRVYFKSQFYTRKRIKTDGKKGNDRARFLLFLKSIRPLRHPHLASIWATYSQEDYSYMLLTPLYELTLKTCLDDPPKSFKSLPKLRRRELLLTWLACLTSTVAYLHEHKQGHGSLRPSVITISPDHKLYVSDFAALSALDDSIAPHDRETYEYGAPESWQRKAICQPVAPQKTTLPGGGRTRQRLPKEKRLSTPRSSATSSSSSSNSRTVVTTFSANSHSFTTAPSADVFSLGAIILTILSALLSYTPKTCAAYRAKHNRTAGRGGAIGDASFHANLGQVGKWMDILIKDAEKMKKSGGDRLMMETVTGLVGLCSAALRKDSGSRPHAVDLDRDISHFVGRGVGKPRDCCGVIEAVPILNARTLSRKVSRSGHVHEPTEAERVHENWSEDGSERGWRGAESSTQFDSEPTEIGRGDENWPLRAESILVLDDYL